MAGLTSGDRPENGTVAGQRDIDVRADEQTLSDRDQTLADADQTQSDADQSAADGDQAAADSDQAASDRDFAHGGDPDVHGQTRDLRHHNAQLRGKTAGRRYEAAARRDAIADERDLVAQERDRAAAKRDRELAARDAAWASDARATTAAEVLLRATDDRRRAAADRAAAAAARESAAADRAQAATDRERAARERARARADRGALLRQLLVAETDALTGARTRGAGLADLDHEVERARRTNELLAVAYIDLVGLKQVNDTRGHAAGDALLRRVVEAIRGQLRAYDLIVRVGGDEFVCALAGATLHDARTRFATVQSALARPPNACEIKVGLAELKATASAEDLIALADADLPGDGAT